MSGGMDHPFSITGTSVPVRLGVEPEPRMEPVRPSVMGTYLRTRRSSWHLARVAIAGVVLAGPLAGPLAGCGAAGPGPGTATDSGISGVTVAGPQCPVQTSGRPCPPQPVSARILVQGASGASVTTFTSDRSGQFRVRLPAGSYTLLTGDAPGAQLRPVQVSVAAHQFTQLRLVLDSGIR